MPMLMIITDPTANLILFYHFQACLFIQAVSFLFPPTLIPIILVSTQLSLQYFLYNKGKSMAFTHNQPELNFDSTAFLLFLFSGCLLIGLILLGFLMKAIWERIKENNKYKGLQKVVLFSNKLKNKKLINEKRFIVWDHKYKFAGLLFCLIIVLLCFNNKEFGKQLTGFDPYEILGVTLSATQSQIKKAYRKLALDYHPDRSNHSSNIFIRISKAYECLMQPQTSCLNSEDDSQAYKIGIGLPPHVLQPPFNFYFALPLFLLFLVVVPIIFFKWLNQKENVHEEFSSNQEIMHRFIGFKDLDSIKLCIVFGAMNETSSLFKSLGFKQNSEAEIRSILEHSYGIAPQKLNKINSKQLYTAYQVYQHMTKQTSSLQISQKFSEVHSQIIKFALLYTKKNNRLLSKLKNQGKKFLGLKPLMKCIQFSRQMFNQSQNPTNHNPFKFLIELSENQTDRISIYKGINLQSIICSELETEKYLKLLEPQKSSQLKQYIHYLPHLELQTSITVAEKRKTKIRRDDIVFGKVTVSKINETAGAVICLNFPTLAEETFLLVVSIGGSLITSLLFNFSLKRQVNHTFKIKNIPKKELKLKINVFSLNYYNLDLSETVKIKIEKTKRKIKKVYIHQEDQILDKMPKNFFQSLVNFEKQTFQYTELSDGESQEEKRVSDRKQTKISSIELKNRRDLQSVQKIKQSQNKAYFQEEND